MPPDTAEENIQSRCRGVLLMGISNKTGRMLLTTGNKSEVAVGYATLYGDMAGGFAPIKDCSKLLVYRLAAWRNDRSRVIPPRVITRPPSAELKPDQKDTDNLPPYEILDPILEAFIEEDLVRGSDRGPWLRQGDRWTHPRSPEAQRVQAAPSATRGPRERSSIWPRLALPHHERLSVALGVLR